MSTPKCNKRREVEPPLPVHLNKNYVLENLCSLVITSCHHTSPTSRHSGIRRMLQLCTRQYWWPTMAVVVKRYIKCFLPLPAFTTALQTTDGLVTHVFCHYSLPEDMLRHCGPRYTSRVWRTPGLLDEACGMDCILSRTSKPRTLQQPMPTQHSINERNKFYTRFEVSQVASANYKHPWLVMCQHFFKIM